MKFLHMFLLIVNLILFPSKIFSGEDTDKSSSDFAKASADKSDSAKASSDTSSSSTSTGSLPLVFTKATPDTSSSSSSSSLTLAPSSLSSSSSSTSSELNEEQLVKLIGKRLVDELNQNVDIIVKQRLFNFRDLYEGQIPSSFNFLLYKKLPGASVSFDELMDSLIENNEIQKFDNLLKIFVINGFLENNTLLKKALISALHRNRFNKNNLEFLKIFLQYRFCEQNFI